mmetsp:Transcript_20528/g.28986  ORF Transcript_20528/g.28986 Transcript_20528/m.28986 type:complete len:644 (+) Transcript_20528:294-2225(+)
MMDGQHKRRLRASHSMPEILSSAQHHGESIDEENNIAADNDSNNNSYDESDDSWGNDAQPTPLSSPRIIPSTPIHPAMTMTPTQHRQQSSPYTTSETCSLSPSPSPVVRKKSSSRRIKKRHPSSPMTLKQTKSQLSHHQQHSCNHRISNALSYDSLSSTSSSSTGKTTASTSSISSSTKGATQKKKKLPFMPTSTKSVLKGLSVFGILWILSMAFVATAMMTKLHNAGKGAPSSARADPISPMLLNEDLVDEDAATGFTRGARISQSNALRPLPQQQSGGKKSSPILNHQIPLPLPPNKVSVVLINYSRPRMIRSSSLMRTMLSHPNIDEVLLLHANPKTAFEFVHPKVVNIDATQHNDEMGLSLRFYFCQLAQHDWVIHVDDDMEFPTQTLNELLIEYSRNPKRIVGRFGRDLVEHNSFNGYNSHDSHKSTEVVLTKLMVMERQICSKFFEYGSVIWEDLVLNSGEGPLWNGEDIFMSLVANHVYEPLFTENSDSSSTATASSGTIPGKEHETQNYDFSHHRNNYAMDWLDVRQASESLKDYDNGKLDISGGMSGFKFWDWHWYQSIMRRNRHYSYRGTLWRTARDRLAELTPFEQAQTQLQQDEQQHEQEQSITETHDNHGKPGKANNDDNSSIVIDAASS